MSMKELIDWLKTDEGKADMKEYFGKLAVIEDIKVGRFKKFEKWLEENDFDKLLYRLVLEHDDAYVDKCYENGVMPSPNRKMQFVFDYVTEHAGRPIKKGEVKEFDDCSFTHQEWEFSGYYFGIMWGQGAVVSIWNKDDKRKIFGM